MKKTFKLSSLLVAGLLALTACSDDFEYTPAGAPNETSSIFLDDDLVYAWRDFDCFHIL